MQNFAEARNPSIAKNDHYSQDIIVDATVLESYLSELNSRLYTITARLCGEDMAKSPGLSTVKPDPRGGTLGELHAFIQRSQTMAENITHHINRLATL